MKPILLVMACGLALGAAPQPNLGVWLPVRLFARYTVFTTDVANRIIGGPEQPYADGLSTYRNFRRFDRKPGLTIK